MITRESKDTRIRVYAGTYVTHLKHLPILGLHIPGLDCDSKGLGTSAEPNLRSRGSGESRADILLTSRFVVFPRCDFTIFKTIVKTITLRCRSRDVPKDFPFLFFFSLCTWRKRNNVCRVDPQNFRRYLGPNEILSPLIFVRSFLFFSSPFVTNYYTVFVRRAVFFSRLLIV